MTEKTRENVHQDQPGLFDVFLSYRHHDAHRIDYLKQKIKFHGFKAFRDLDFPSLGDPSNITPEKIDVLRRLLSRTTCLIFAYSRPPAEETAKQDSTLTGQCISSSESPAVGGYEGNWGVPQYISSSSESLAVEVTAKQDSALGVWMPWELGFFDGNMMSYRIGVYLLDHLNGEPEDLKPQEYFEGCEYLQLYTRLTDLNLKEFLDRNAVRERRIDNVASTFVWFEHLCEEYWANPTNLALGVAEWCVGNAAHHCQERGITLWANAFKWWKKNLENSRVTWVRCLRLWWFDALFDAMYAQQQKTAAMVAEVARVVTEAKGAETQPLQQEDRPAAPANQSSAPLPMINPWFLFEPLFAAIAPLGSGIATGRPATTPTPALPPRGRSPLLPFGETGATGL